MTKGHTRTPKISRRALLAAMPATGAALALPTPALSNDRAAILDVIQELESYQGWETSSVVAAKAYAAYRMREALGMPLTDAKKARTHLEYQNQSFEAYRRSALYERDLKEGKAMHPPRPTASI